MPSETISVHRSFWIVAGILLVWNGLGCVNFFAQMNAEILAGYRESEQAIVTGRPFWATAGFAFAVFGGALGAVLLLLRQGAATYLFVASLIGVIVTMIHALGLGVALGPGEFFGIILMPLVVAAFSIGYAKYAQRRQWISGG